MTKHGRRILLKTRGFLGRSVAVFAGAVMLLTNVPAVNADKSDRITESAEKVCQWQRDKMYPDVDSGRFFELWNSFFCIGNGGGTVFPVHHASFAGNFQ